MVKPHRPTRTSMGATLAAAVGSRAFDVSRTGEHIRPGGAGDGEHAGMLEAPLRRDGVVPFADGGRAADLPHAVQPAHVVGDGGRRWKRHARSLADDLHQRRILELTNDAGTQLLLLAPLVESTA